MVQAHCNYTYSVPTHTKEEAREWAVGLVGWFIRLHYAICDVSNVYLAIIIHIFFICFTNKRIENRIRGDSTLHYRNSTEIILKY